MASQTPNLNLTYPVHGASVNSWDTPLNTDFDTIDAVAGGTYSFSGAGGGAGSTLTQTQANNHRITITGLLTVQNYLITFPAIGGLWVIDNQTTGAFTVSCLVTGSIAAAINCVQGSHTLVSSNATNMSLADDSVTKAQLYTYLGNPNTNVAGTLGATNASLTDAIWDSTDRQIYVATLTGNAATTVWAPQNPRITPEGYLSTSADTSNPIVASDVTATTINYVPYVGNWTVLSNGTILYPYQFSAMALVLSGSQAANQIYDVFMWANPTAGIISPIIGTGPVWSTTTPGSCARGAGAGTTQLSRLAGIWTNAVQVTLINGASTYTCPAGQGVYLGSIYVDSTAGHVTCNISYGNTIINTWATGNIGRKWGIWNAYNRSPIYLQAGDSTANWTYTTATWRASNAASNNSGAAFCGLPEEAVGVNFTQNCKFNNVGGGGQAINVYSGIGVNSITATSGKYGFVYGANVSGFGSGGPTLAEYILAPQIGVNVFNSLENSDVNISASSWLGTNSNMLLKVSWRG